MVSEETAHTDTKRLLQTLKVQNRLQAVLKGRRCSMVEIRAAPLLTINPRSTLDQPMFPVGGSLFRPVAAN